MRIKRCLSILVSKELLDDVQSGSVKLPAVPGAKNAQSWDISDLNNQLKLFRLREQFLVKEVTIVGIFFSLVKKFRDLICESHS